MTVETREETGVEAACDGAAEKAIRARRMKAALARGDTDTYLHERLALGHASSDVEHQRRFVVPTAPAPRKVVRPSRPPRRDRRPKGGRRPRARRVASRSSGGGSSGDDDLAGSPLSHLIGPKSA